MFTPPRIDQPELLDMGMGTPAEVRESLHDLWRVNVLLGGVWSLMWHLSPRIRALPAPTVVDLGAGDGRLAHEVAQKHPAATVIPLDFSTRHLRHAHHDLSLLQADALHLPFADSSVDIVMSSLMLHHFAPEQVITILRESTRVATHHVVMADLMRGYDNELAWRVGRYLLARSPITHHDGLVSVRRSYTPTEFLEFAHAAGCRSARVFTPLRWRMILVIDLQT